MENKVYEEVEKLLKVDGEFIKQFKKLFRFKVIITFCFHCFYLSLILGIALIIFVNLNSLNISPILTFLPLISSGISFIVFYSLEKKLNFIKRVALIPLLKNINWKFLYAIVVKNIFKNKDIEITEVEINGIEHWSKNQKNPTASNRIYFEYKNAIICFSIRTDVKYGYLPFKSSKSKNTNQTHIWENLRVTRKDLVFKEEVYLRGNIPSSSTYESESVLFNEKFNIKSDKPLIAAKYFSPKIIENYLKINSSEKFDFAKFNNNGIEVMLTWTKNKIDYEYEIGLFKIYRTWKKQLQGIVDEMVEDINKFQTAFEYVKPFLD